MLQYCHYSLFKRFFCLTAIGILSIWSSQTYAQDTTKSILDINNSKLVKKANQFLDSNQKKINSFFNKKIASAKEDLNKKTNSLLEKSGINEIDKPLPYERLLNKKYTLGRRAYQNTVSQFNYLFNAEVSLNEIIQKARDQHEDDFTELLPFYDYDLSVTAKESIDSIIYRCNANIVLHDLRSNYVDDAYLLLAKAYLFHKNFDTAASILQFINYSFYDKEAEADLPIGSNLNNTGKFSIASAENNRAWENKNVRNESMIWQARNYFEAGELNEGISLLQLLKTDAGFPKRLHPFLFEQLAYGYYQSGIYDSAANYLIKGLDNAQDLLTKARWSYLIAQMFEKEQKIDLAYQWYRKAGTIASEPIIAVYASIYMASIDASRGEKSWESLANALERMLKRDKYQPFADIIYYEMAQLALRNQATKKANQWLIASIQKNERNSKLKQKALVQLGALNYQADNFEVAKIAYEQLTGLLKSYPNYEQIALRIKWINKIATTAQIIAKEDSLQYIYTLPEKDQEAIALAWQKRIAILEAQNIQLLIDPKPKNTAETSQSLQQNNNQNKGYTFPNAFATTSMTKQAPKNDFYFDNPQNIITGNTNFIKKWGDRPNVDNWRRKTSIQLTKSTPINNSLAPEMQVSSLNNKSLLKKQKNDTAKALSIALLQTKSDLEKSIQIWNTNTLSIARTFLYELNDFEKAYPRYKLLIEKNIDSTTTENALLDLASHYLHIGESSKSDSIIKIITSQFPEGSYIKKKNAKETIDLLNKNSAEVYKENYFLAQIGDWDNFKLKMNEVEKQFRGTKWQTPYQFLKVKMYAQEQLDSVAIELLNEIIAQNKIESIKARAKNIITEINNRKATEQYLKDLKIVKITKPAQTEDETDKKEKNQIVNSIQNAENKIANKQKKDSTLIDTSVPQLVFTNDSLEQHYIAIQTTNVTTTFVKEIQNALKDVHAEEFKKLNLSVTFVQFTEQSHLVWIGPFVNAAEGILYIQKIKPRLSTEIISFIPKKQYELILIGKSNIVQIMNEANLTQYKRDKVNYNFKP